MLKRIDYGLQGAANELYLQISEDSVEHLLDLSLEISEDTEWVPTPDWTDVVCLDPSQVIEFTDVAQVSQFRKGTPYLLHASLAVDCRVLRLVIRNSIY